MRYDKVADPFYKTKAWRNARWMALGRDMHMCVECMAAYERHEISEPRPATVVHHIKPRKEYPELALELNNLQSLCDACHNKKHPEKGEKETPGAISAAGVRIIKV